MLRFITALSIAFTLIAAAGLYSVNYQTRALEHKLKTARDDLESLTREVETLKAERAFLARPERIEPIARNYGMQPARGEQFLQMGDAGPIRAQDTAR